MPLKLRIHCGADGGLTGKSLLIRLERESDRLDVWAGHHPWTLLAVFSVGYFGLTIAISALRRFWFDELFTYHISLLPTLDDIARALALSIDKHPPPFFWISRAAAAIGPVHIGLRLPAVVGVWLACVSIFWFVARRSTVLFGAVAIALVLGTDVFSYAVEARPYGLVIGFAALALLCWQLAADGVNRRLALCGLAAAIAGALSSSYYAVLLLLPLVAGEAVRSWTRRRIDPGVLAALALGSAVMLAYLPLAVHGVQDLEPGGWANPTLRSIPTAYRALMANVWLPLLGFIALIGIALTIRESEGDAARAALPPAIPSYELAAAIVLLMLPFPLYAVAKLVTYMMTARYVLPTVLGFAILVAWILFRTTKGRPIVATTLVVMLMAGTVTEKAADVRRSTRDRGAPSTLRTMLRDQPAELTVAVDDPLRCLESMFYEDGDIASRLWYLVDAEGSRRYGRVYYPGKAWLRLKDLMPLKAEEVESFRTRHARYLVYSTGASSTYLLPMLVAEGADVRTVAAVGAERLYLVTERPPHLQDP